MDYHSLHGQDISNFSSSFAHRMPTVSAAQALQDLNSPATRRISTGLQGLDCALQNREALTSDAAGGYVGVSRGQVTEVYGPPGVGKTALGIQTAANVLRDGQGVVWVDAAHPLPGPRLKEALLYSSLQTAVDVDQPSSSAELPNASGLLKNFDHFTTPTLPHLIALLCHTTPSFPSQNASLIVIDSLSVLIAAAYPRNLENGPTANKVGSGPKHDSQMWAAGRKWSVLQYVISFLQKLASLRNLAIILLNQSVTKMQSGAGAILVSAVQSTAWDAGVATSVALFRDWGWEGKQVRYARVLRANGVAGNGRGSVEKVLAFTIEWHGLVEFQLADTNAIIDTGILGTPSRKRKADEIRDSEDENDLEGSDEDYGWVEEDDGQLPQPPPQWQGSEDIWVPGDDERADDEDEEEQAFEEEAQNGEIEDESLAPDALNQLPRGVSD